MSKYCEEREKEEKLKRKSSAHWLVSDVFSKLLIFARQKVSWCVKLFIVQWYDMIVSVKTAIFFWISNLESAWTENFDVEFDCRSQENKRTAKSNQMYVF